VDGSGDLRLGLFPRKAGGHKAGNSRARLFPGGRDERGTVSMAVKILKIGAKREALALVCDCPAHVDGARTAWFDCGSQSGNISVAKAAGWIEGYGPAAWLCPQCAQGSAQKQKTRRKGSVESLSAIL